MKKNIYLRFSMLVMMLCLSLGCTSNPTQTQIKSDVAAQYLDLGVMWEDLGNNKKAEKSYRIALYCDETRKIALTNLANVYAKQNKFDKAVKLYQQAIDKYQDPYACNNLAWLYIDWDHNISAATELAKQAVSLAQESSIKSYCCHTAGIAFGLQSDFDRAISYLKQAYQTNTDDDSEYRDQLCLDLARYTMLAGRLQEAFDILNQATDCGRRHDAQLLQELRWRLMLRMQENQSDTQILQTAGK